MTKIPAKIDITNGAAWVPLPTARVVNDLIEAVTEIRAELTQLQSDTETRIDELIEQRTAEIGLSPADFLLHWESGVLESTAENIELLSLIKAQRAIYRSRQPRRETTRGKRGETRGRQNEDTASERRTVLVDLNEVNRLVWAIFSMLAEIEDKNRFECEYDYDTHEQVITNGKGTIRIDRDGRMVGLNTATRYLVLHAKGGHEDEDDQVTAAPV